MLRRRLALLATIAAGAAMLVGCVAQAPSVTTAEPADVPADLVDLEVAAAYAVGEHEGVVYTAIESESGEWCLLMQGPDDPVGRMHVCGGGDVVTASTSALASARLEIDGVLDASDGTAISDWVVVLD